MARWQPGMPSFADVYPELVAQWSVLENPHLDPSMFGPGSARLGRWRPACGHLDEREAYRKARNPNCPICAKSKTNLVRDYPHLAKEIHPTKNDVDFDPCHIMSQNNQIWWLGQICGHEWPARIFSRIKGAGCPTCSGNRVHVGENDLATTHPELAAEWHPTLNKYNAHEVTAGYSKKVWWLCSLGHAWEAKVYVRRDGGGYCRKCISIAYTHPDVARLLHPTENGGLTAEDVTQGQNILRAWLGETCGHTWWAKPANVVRGKGCAVCDGAQVLAGFNDLLSQRPEFALQWHPTKNLRGPEMCHANSSNMAWWLCSLGHEWEQAPQRRSTPSCSICDGRIFIAGTNDFATLYPKLAAEWHPTKNGICKPHDFVYKAVVKVWWLGRCGHEWPATINHRTQRGSGCPICSGSQLLTGYNDLATTFPEILHLWDYELNTLTPQQVARGSNMIISWHDKKCGHRWPARVREVAKPDGTRCPYCAGNKLLPGFNDLATIAPWLVVEWDWVANGDLTPSTVLAETKQKINWVCNVCNHHWPALAHPRIHRDVGCPKCTIGMSKIQKKLCEELFVAGLPTILNVKLPVCWSKRYSISWVDIYFETTNHKWVVEYDGGYWHDERYDNDVLKTSKLLAAGYRVIRVRDSRLPSLQISDVSYSEIIHVAHHRLNNVVDQVLAVMNS